MLPTLTIITTLDISTLRPTTRYVRTPSGDRSEIDYQTVLSYCQHHLYRHHTSSMSLFSQMQYFCQVIIHTTMHTTPTSPNHQTASQQLSIIFRQTISPQCFYTSWNIADKSGSHSCSLVVLEAWPWPRGSSRTPHEGLGLGLGLDTSGLGLGLGLERKVLALTLA